MVIAKTEEVSGRRDVSSPFFLCFGVSVIFFCLAFGGAFDAFAVGQIDRTDRPIALT
jgi:hypothetical protein